MTVRLSPEDDHSGFARRAAERELRELAVTPSDEARAGRAEGAGPAAPRADEHGWWEKQLGVTLDLPLDAA